MLGSGGRQQAGRIGLLDHQRLTPGRHDPDGRALISADCELGDRAEEVGHEGAGDQAGTVVGAGAVGIAVIEPAYGQLAETGVRHSNFGPHAPGGGFEVPVAHHGSALHHQPARRTWPHVSGLSSMSMGSRAVSRRNSDVHLSASIRRMRLPGRPGPN